MKVLLINDHSKMVGGTETFVHSIKKALKEKHNEGTIFGSDKGENFASLFSRWYSIKWYWKTIKEIKKFKPDIVHVNNCVRIISPSVINAALKLKVPVILTFHDDYFLCHRLGGIYKGGRTKKGLIRHKCFFPDCMGYDEKVKDFPRNIWKKVKLVFHRKVLNWKKINPVSLSKMFARNLKKSLGVNAEIIPNGVEIPEETTDYKKIILYVGEINKEKGLQTIAPVLNKVEGYKVQVLGRGPLKKYLESKYKNIEFLGFQNSKEYYRKASIMIVPSIWMEDFPYTTIEAMSYGLCVIASRVGSIPEQIKHLKTGLLFEPGNKRDFKKNLNYLLKNPNEIKTIGKNAREDTSKYFSKEKMINSYLELYKKVVDERNNKN